MKVIKFLEELSVIKKDGEGYKKIVDGYISAPCYFTYTSDSYCHLVKYPVKEGNLELSSVPEIYADGKDLLLNACIFYGKHRGSVIIDLEKVRVFRTEKEAKSYFNKCVRLPEIKKLKEENKKLETKMNDIDSEIEKYALIL